MADTPQEAQEVQEVAEIAAEVAAEAIKQTEEPKSASEVFQDALHTLMSGRVDEITPQQWEVLALQGALRVALVLVILFMAITIAGWLGATVHSALRRMKFDATLTKFVSKLVRWGILLLAGLSCLSYFGVETTSFAAIIGAAGLAVGLAFQGTLSNFASGAMLLLFRPFKVGDVVKLDDSLGVVDEIELFTTSIDTFDNRRLILPNSSVFGSKIENLTFHRKRRVDVAVGAAYDADIDATREALLEAARRAEDVLSEPEPDAILIGLGASSVDWEVRVWVRTPDYLDVKQSLTRAVKNSLDEAGIGIPFPQLDVHMQKDAG